MAQVVTLYIDDTSIRLLVAKGKRVIKWANLQLEPGLVSDGAIINEEEVAAKIQGLLESQEVKVKKVIVGLSGLHCLTRSVTLPKLPKALLPEAINQEAERIMPVPLEQLYLSWQIIPAPGEEIQVFLAASPRNATDALIGTLHKAGLDPYIIDLKPLALARVANETTAIIVDVQSTEMDIVIMVDGVPQPVRSLALPSKAPTLPEQLSTIFEELERTIKFYNASYPEKPLDPSTPIFISGELTQESDAFQSLANELEHPVLPLSPPLQCPEGLNPSQYMVNIGLALKEISLPKGEANLSVVNLNALPESYKPQPIQLTRILLVPGIIIVAIGLLLPLVTLVRSTSADTALLRSELATINQIIEQRQRQKQGIAELETKVEEAQASRDTFTTAIDLIDDNHLVINGDLEVTTSALPDTVDLSYISHISATNTLTIRGSAPTEIEALAYARDLRGSGRFSQVVISNMKITDNGMEFTLTLLDEERGSTSTPVEEVQD